MALTILVTGAVSMLVLVSAMSVARSVSELQTVAVNLAREGIEFSRSIRDSNWLQNIAFDTTLNIDDTHSFVPKLDPSTNLVALDFSPQTIDDAAWTKIFKYNELSTYFGLMVNFQATPPPGSDLTATPFQRIVYAYPICEDGSVLTSGQCSDMTYTEIGLKIVCEVQWSERNRTHRVKLEEDLYDWQRGGR